MSNWNHLKIMQNIPQQPTAKTRHQEPKENSNIVHCAHTSESANVEEEEV
jgi:hypothetical protein